MPGEQKNRPARHLSSVLRVVLGLAIASCATSVIILLLPVDTLADRDQLSVAVSTAFALVTGIIAVTLTARISSSDHLAEQQVKADIATLLASMRSILVKGAAMLAGGMEPGRVDFQNEKKQVNEFMSSTTAFAMWSWVGERSEQAQSAPEEWRVFFLRLVEILASSDKDKNAMFTHSIEIERGLSKLSEKEVLYISSRVSNLAKAVSEFNESREQDVVLKAMVSVFGAKQDGEELNYAKLLHIKAKGVKDPNLDLFLAVSSKLEI